MNYYGPREIADENGTGIGKWRYTVRNDDRVYAVGYCADGCPGHDTPEEAREHYRQYTLDHAHEAEFRPPSECLICGAWTPKGFDVDHHTYALCDEHRTREHLDPLVKPGDAISSY